MLIPKTKVYAPLCLAPENAKRGIVPDYSPAKTVLDVFTNLVEFSLSQLGKEFDFLGYATWTPHPTRAFPADWKLTEVPSWMPNRYELTKHFPIHKTLYIEKHIPERTLAPCDRRALQSLQNNER